jgi:hypothetical protein
MERTMADARVGYVSNDDAVGFANMGRLTAHHGVVATRHFVNPLRLGRADVVAMFNRIAINFELLSPSPPAMAFMILMERFTLTLMAMVMEMLHLQR